MHVKLTRYFLFNLLPNEFSFDPNMITNTRQEESILRSSIQLSSNSSSYAQYLESLPTNKTQEYDKVAQIVLRASKYLLNNNCKRYVYHSHSCVICIVTEKQKHCVTQLKFAFVNIHIGLDLL